MAAKKRGANGHKLLTHKQQRFCEEFLVDGNAAQAAIRAGYSPTCAKQIGAENLTKPDLAAVIAQGRKELTERSEYTAEQTINAIGAIAHDEDEHLGYRLKALELLGKSQGIFVEKHDVKHSGSISDGDPGLQATMDLLKELAAARDSEK